MDHEFRSRLAAELSAVPQPPIGDLVEASVHRGRRLRTVRRWRYGATGVAAFVALGVAAAQLAPAGGAGAQAGAPGLPLAVPATATPSATAGPTVPPAPAVTLRPGAPATGKKVKATPEGILELLVSLLPEGRTSHYAGVTGTEGTMVETYVDNGDGPGMLRLVVAPYLGGTTEPQAGGATLPPQSETRRCVADKCDESASDAPEPTQTELPDGSLLTVTENPDNCVQSTLVELYRVDHVKVQALVATCRNVDGAAVEAPPALTTGEAVALVTDPRFGTRMATSLVEAGAVHFPHLPTIG